jgi:hypothetical protein
VVGGEEGGGFGELQEHMCYTGSKANIGRSGRHPGVISAEHYSTKSE